jgi:hypothetical protein
MSFYPALEWPITLHWMGRHVCIGWVDMYALDGSTCMHWMGRRVCIGWVDMYALDGSTCMHWNGRPFGKRHCKGNVCMP